MFYFAKIQCKCHQSDVGGRYGAVSLSAMIPYHTFTEE
jgi:hypothetical protein